MVPTLQEPAPFDTLLTPEEAHGRLVTAPWGDLGLFRRADGAFVAVDAWCPHLDGPLWEGTAGGRDELACPWHGWRFSLRTGRCTWARPSDADEARESSVRVFQVELGPGGTLVVQGPC
jgi:nitrite reductase/ring-hydroxylating ferredoxin subunit